VRSRSYLLVLLATFLFFLAVNAFALLPGHLARMGATSTSVGHVMGTMQVVTAVVMPLVGLLLHRVSARGSMVRGAALLAAACVGLSMVEGWSWLLFLGRAAQGLAFAMFFVSAGALVVTLVPASRRAEGIARFGAAMLVTNALATLAGEWLLRWGTFSDLCLAAGGCAAAAAATSLFIAPTAAAGEAPTPLAALMRVPAFAAGLVALAATALGFGTVFSFLSAFAAQEGLGAVSPFFAAYTAASLVVRFTSGRLADRRDRRLVIAPSLGVASLAIAGLGAARSGVHLAALGTLYGAATGLAFPALMAFVVDQAEEADRARAVALDNWAFTIGVLVATATFGPLADSIGARTGFVVVAAAGAIGCTLPLLVRPRVAAGLPQS